MTMIWSASGFSFTPMFVPSVNDQGANAGAGPGVAAGGPVGIPGRIKGVVMTLPDLLFPTYLQLLTALSSWLAKAETPDGEAEALPAARLAPDMFPLATQVRFACVQAQEGVHRLSGQDFPPAMEDLLNEARNAVARPGTIADARARIEETLAIVRAVAAQALDVDPASPIAHALPNGMIFDLTAEQYARDWALPQFYFHVMAAYAILRAQGMELGKVDYVAHMFAYLRPGSMPQQ
jgi:hypothetical protein